VDVVEDALIVVGDDDDDDDDEGGGHIVGCSIGDLQTRQ